MATFPSARGVTGGPPRVDGKFLLVDGRRFLVRGVAYGTFAPDAEGAQFPPAGRIDEDFASMAAHGFNTVRTYTAPPIALLDAAARHGLRVMVGVPWPHHVAFLSDGGLRRRIRRDVMAAVRERAAHPAVLLFAVGNEILPSVVRWHGRRPIERFLRELYHGIKSELPDTLLTCVNFPPTEYLDLDGFDLCAFNVYVHREPDLRAYLARLQHIAGPKPLLLAEAGADSLREGADGQARILAAEVRAAFAEGACGAVAFSWTDDWWRGGHTVHDWAFGLVDAQRRPKPALAAAAAAFDAAPFSRDDRSQWPMVSVVVCARDAAQTIDDCLTSLAALTYPRLEVLVVNDGSRDRTAALARRYAGVQVIDVAHGGLSAARNAGLAAASGEIVAYTDADVRVDPDWLTYLVQPLLTPDVAGAGGPNVVPPDDPWMAQCVARAPGGPTHVLLDDRIAEHVPGCNMAFRRDALLAIGGFHPLYVRAGDDVDVCWRLQAGGQRIGFAAAALVWHHHRTSVRAFWRQQVGYGEAETWLQVHHPGKFAGGGMLWRGRLYSPLPFARAFQARRVNTGVWGTAAFPSVYVTGTHPVRFLPHSPAWMAACSALILMAAALPAPATAWLLAAGVAGWTTTLARCAGYAWRSDLRGLPRIASLSPGQSDVVQRLVIAWLHVLQPIARMAGRMRGLRSMPHAASAHVTRADWNASRPAPRHLGALGRLLTGTAGERSFWSESWVPHTAVLTELAGLLRAVRPIHIVELDDGWQADRDLSVAVGRWGWLHVRVLVEEHSEGRCLLRTSARLRPGRIGAVPVLALMSAPVAAAAVAAIAEQSWLPTAAFIAAAGIAARGFWQIARAAAVFDEALTRVTAGAGMIPLTAPRAAPSMDGTAGRPATSIPLRWWRPHDGAGTRRARHGTPAAADARRPIPMEPVAGPRAALAAVIVLLTASLGFGGVSFGRDLLATLTGAAQAIPDVTASGGVAVGLAGDVFVADARPGTIRRLRPRPPLDAVWTADDIGTDGDPLLGHAVSFDTASDIAVAPNGDVYVADARHHRICRIVRSSGAILTIAGSGTPGFHGDGGPAVSASLHGPSAVAVARNGDIHIADTLNHRIRVISHATGIITTMAGDGRTAADAHVGDDGPARQARLNRPSGLAVAPNGDIYVADTGHARVRRISARTGTITTIAGDGRTVPEGGNPAQGVRLAAPTGLALASSGGRLAVYVTDLLTHAVHVIEPGGMTATVEGSERLRSPARVAYHPAGWLYVKDASPDGVTVLAASRPRLATAAAAKPPGRKGT